MENFDYIKYLKNNPLLNEIKVNNPNDPKRIFTNLVKDYRNCHKKYQDELIEAYRTKNFTDELVNKIIESYAPFYKKYKQYSVGNEEMFKEWIQGIKTEALPMGSSGSFATSLLDEDFLYTVGEELGLEEEDIEEIVNG